MKTRKYFYKLEILKNHIDLFGHVNNAVYLQFLEAARWDLIASNGFNGIELIQQTEIGPIILEANLKFRKELVLNQKIVIETEFLSYNSRIAILHQDIKNQLESNDSIEKIYCKAEFKFAHFHLKERKLVLPSSLWLRALGLEEKIAPKEGCL